jgi:hypothetical protein
VKKTYWIYIVLAVAVLLSSCTLSRNGYRKEGRLEKPGKTAQLVQKIIENSKSIGKSEGLLISYPYDRAVFPPEIASPTISWIDKSRSSKHWLVTVVFENSKRSVYAFTNGQQWIPGKKEWETIKANSVNTPAVITVMGISSRRSGHVTGKRSISISTSIDRVDASVFYRQVQIPFTVGKKGFKKLKWRLGDISSYDKPPVVMGNIPVCASCHMFSKDGKVMSMEMNHNNDSGAQFVTRVKKHIELTEDDFISWNDFPKLAILPKTRGVFAKLSPSGRHIVSTVNEISFLAMTNDPAFSELFFPTYGVLAWYSVDDKRFALLPGADDYNLIQTDPSWRWDGKYIAFSRTETNNQYHEDIGNIITRLEDAPIHELNKKFPIQFDIYTIPFNNGKGGTPEPLKGAGNNNMSNYFPRYSPDGKWIVFTQSKTGIMLQPDSELYIVPAQGGKARRMHCNRKLFNSWHSWSPNGKWLLFSSKANTMFTEIFITHVDEKGQDSPPVCLSRFSHDRFAANVPEFVNISPDAIKGIRVVSGQ